MDPFDPAPYPEFAHQVAARLARVAREDREAVAGSLRRFGFRVQGEPDRSSSGPTRSPRKAADTRMASRRCDFRYASPIPSTSRQRADMRIPHLAVSHVTRTAVPRSADGATHDRYPARSTVAAEHFDYLTEGARTTYRTHFDYITRRIGSMTAVSGMPAMDILDFEADHRERNALAILSNIPGGPSRQRGLFEAAEQCEREAKRGTLEVSTERKDAWAELAAAADAPLWVKEAARLLEQERAADIAKASKAKRKHRDRLVTIADVDLVEAYDRLCWADEHLGPDNPALPDFKQGRSGRVQTRFVVELPHGLDARQHRTIMQRFCARLDREGWMYVAAIHCPDPKNDPRNIHLHVDAYDRPSKWLDGISTDGKAGGPGCWDFEVRLRKRNGKWQYPYRQKKIGALRGDEGQNRHEAGEAYFKQMRADYVAIANDVANGTAKATRYVTGTYRDNGIRQDRLEHLGDRIVANEKSGLVTKAGSRNARIIFNDRLRDVRHVAAQELSAIRRAAAVWLAQVDDDDAKKIVRQWRYYQRVAVLKRAQAAAATIVGGMAISRAVTVIKHSKNEDRKREAEAWMAEDAVVAGGADQAIWTTDAIAVAADILDDKVRSSLSISTRPITYKHRGHDTLAVVMTKYHDATRGRLLNWLDEHGDDPMALVFENDVATLGPAENRKSINRLFRLFIEDLLVQERLRAIRARRRRSVDGEVIGVEPARTGDSAEQPSSTSVAEERILEAVAATVVQKSIKDVNREIRAKEGRRRQVLLREEAWAKLRREEASISVSGSRYQVDMAALTDQQRLVLTHPGYDTELQARLAEWHTERKHGQAGAAATTSSSGGSTPKLVRSTPDAAKIPPEPPVPLRTARTLREAQPLRKGATLRASGKSAPASPSGVIRQRDLNETADTRSSYASAPEAKTPASFVGPSGKLGQLAETLMPVDHATRPKGKAEPMVPDVRGKGPQGR